MNRIYRIEDLHSKDPKILHQRLQRAAFGQTVDKTTSEANLRMLAAGGFGNAIRVIEGKK